VLNISIRHNWLNYFLSIFELDGYWREDGFVTILF